MDSEKDQEFQGANESQPVSSSSMNLETAIDEMKKSLKYFFNNEFDVARKVMEPWAKSSMYHALGKGAFSFLDAILTFEPQRVEMASEVLKNCIELCDKHRRKSTISETFGKMVKKVNYDAYTPEEIHAELCYAEGLLLKSLLAFIEDETLVSFIKAGIKIRTCFSSYKECEKILQSKHWKNENHKLHFESGVRTGIGAFNLMISILPSRAVKLLEFIGLPGSKNVGLNELEAGYRLRNSLRQCVCAMILLSYHLIILHVLSDLDGNLKLCDEIINSQLQLYPKCVWYLFYKGRLELASGNVEESIKWYTRSWKTQDIWPQFHTLLYWELMWINSIKQDWREASMFAHLLLQHGKWSRTMYCYQKAVMLFMLGDSVSHDEKCEIETLMRDTPKWKQRIAGKSVPMEKFAIKKSERFFAQKRMLIIPAIELIYIWNLFKILGKALELMDGVYKLIEKTQIEIETKKIAQEFGADNQALLLLLKGASLRQMKRPMQAEKSLNSVLALEKQLREDMYLIPYAMVELAHMQWDQGNSVKAVKLLEEAKKNYSGYSLESRLHFKIHAFLTEINEGKKANVPLPSVSTKN